MLEKNYHDNARMATVLIAVSYWPRVLSKSSRSQREGKLVVEESRTLSTGCSHAGTATKNPTVYLNDATQLVLHSAIMG